MFIMCHIVAMSKSYELPASYIKEKIVIADEIEHIYFFDLKFIELPQ